MNVSTVPGSEKGEEAAIQPRRGCQRTWGRGARRYSLVNLDMMVLMLMLMSTDPRAAVSRSQGRLQCCHETAGVDGSDGDRKRPAMMEMMAAPGVSRGPTHYPQLPKHVLWLVASRASMDDVRRPILHDAWGHLTSHGLVVPQSIGEGINY